MKRIIVIAAVALALVGMASAQAAAPVAPAAQTVTVSGKLELIDGVIGLKSGGVTYYTPRLRQLVGFVKEIQEGAQVKLEGYATPLGLPSGYSVLQVTKVTVGGKDYDLPQNGAFGRFGGSGAFGPGMMGGVDRRGTMPGRGSRW